MVRRLPPTHCLLAFEAAARSGSFTRAALELNLSQAAVSRQIAQLEHFLGAELFTRARQRITLTERGAAYAEIVRDQLLQFEDATQRLFGPDSHQLVRVNVFPSLAQTWLARRLPRFRAEHPEVKVQLTTLLDDQLDERQVDVTVRPRSPDRPGLRYDKMFDFALLPVCSPGFLAAGAIDHPGALLAHPMINALNRPRDWQVWFRGVNVATPLPAPEFTFGTSMLAYAAAAAGAGIAVAVDIYVQDDLDAGRLVSPLARKVPSGDVYYIATRNAPRERDAEVKFRDWLIRESQRAVSTIATGQPDRG